jgi:hypothetical protein
MKELPVQSVYLVLKIYMRWKYIYIIETLSKREKFHTS